MSVRIRPVHAEEASALRDLRLQALADAPEAFGSTLGGERVLPDEAWHARAAGDAGRQTFVAQGEDGRWLGIATWLVGEADPAVAELVGMFVVTSERRQGIAAALVEAVCGWARERHCERIELWVTGTNEPAIALYRRCGFTSTGERQPLPHTPALSEMRMVRGL